MYKAIIVAVFAVLLSAYLSVKVKAQSPTTMMVSPTSTMSDTTMPSGAPRTGFGM